MAVKHVGASQTPGVRPAGNSAQTDGARAVAQALMTEIASAPANDRPVSQNSAAPQVPPSDPQAPAATPGSERNAGSVDYYAIICRTIGNLALNNAETRGHVYEHARTFINQRLRETQPPLSSRMIAVEQIAFDRAVKKIEDEQLVNPTIPRVSRVEELAMTLSPDIAPPDSVTADATPGDGIPQEITPGDADAKDRSPAIVVPRRPVRVRRTGLNGGIVRLFIMAAIIIAGIVSYGLATGKLSLIGMREAARSAVNMQPPSQTAATDEPDVAALPVPPSLAAPAATAEQPATRNPPAPDAAGAPVADPPTAEPPSIIDNRNLAADSERATTTYQTQLASFLSLCRPARTAYGDDPCGNLQPRPFGGLGVVPRKAPEWVAMYDSLSQTIPAVRVKNPKFSAPVPNTPATAAAPGSSVPVRSASATAREKFDHGVSLASTDNLDGALADFSEAIRLDPKFSDAYVQRGQAMFKNGNADRAIADFTQALQIDPRNAGAFKARGMAMLYKGDDDGAIIDLTKAIQYAEIDPASIPAVEVFYARRSRASLYDRKQLYDRELIDLTAMIDGYWKNPGLATALKTTYRDQGAATLLASIYRLRAAVNQKRSNPDNAIGDLSLAIQLDPQRALPFVIERARILEATGRKDQAAADYQQALSLSPANTDVKNALERLRGSSK